MKDVYITGVLAIADKFVIVDNDNRKLKFYTGSGDYLSFTTLTESTWGITQVNNDLFATCGFGNQVFLWKMKGNNIIQAEITYKVDHRAHGIHFNGTYYCVLYRNENAVTILDDRGRQVRKFEIKEPFGKKVTFGWDIHNDRDMHHVYMPCVDDIKGILCVSIQGEMLRFNGLDGRPEGIAIIRGLLCVVHCDNDCVKDLGRLYVPKCPA